MTNIAIFASGNGTNFEAIVNAVNNKIIKNAVVSILIVDRHKAYAIERAKKLNIPYVYVNATKFNTREEYENEIINILKPYNIDIICLAGYMKILTHVLLDEYENRIINIHPALLPSFKGAHGIKDAFDYGCKVFGVTVHYVSSELDSGKIIAQRAFEYYGNSLDDLETKIHSVEHILYPEAINMVIEEKQK
ncbi:MAG: phosphoribosylglycinamide formyltransferase [Acholeplasmatales bacterium]|nr:phosphoribosylglycinamide formyltransferase [Acholeplasmatales bacterium]